MEDVCPYSALGGKPPRKVFYKDFVEHLTTHDGTICTVIWNGEVGNVDHPLYSHQIYDTTQGPRTHSHLDHIASKIHNETLRGRDITDGQYQDRLDFYGLPLASGTSTEDIIQMCIDHQWGEISARMATGKADYFIQRKYDTSSCYKRLLFVIMKPEPEWEQDEAFIAVHYDLKPRAGAENDRQPNTYRCSFTGMAQLADHLVNAKMKQEWFYDTYVPEGYLQKELERGLEK